MRGMETSPSKPPTEGQTLLSVSVDARTATHAIRSTAPMRQSATLLVTPTATWAQMRSVRRSSNRCGKHLNPAVDGGEARP
jgi:hypothetical protein